MGISLLPHEHDRDSAATVKGNGCRPFMTVHPRPMTVSASAPIHCTGILLAIHILTVHLLTHSSHTQHRQSGPGGLPGQGQFYAHPISEWDHRERERDERENEYAYHPGMMRERERDRQRLRDRDGDVMSGSNVPTHSQRDRKMIDPQLEREHSFCDREHLPFRERDAIAILPCSASVIATATLTPEFPPLTLIHMHPSIHLYMVTPIPITQVYLSIQAA